MLSAGPSFIILGVVVAWATADNSTVLLLNSSMSVNVTVTPFPSNATGTFTTSDGNRSSTTAQGMSISTAVQPTSTFTPSHPPATTTSKGRGRTKTKAPKVTAKPVSELDDSPGIIILVVIIIIALGFGLACYFARKRGRRYSVDFNSRADEANIPLSTVEPGLTADAVTQNGLKTFESADFSYKEAGGEAKVELEAEAGSAAADPSAASAAPVKPPDTAKDAPKGDVVEWTPPAMSVEEKTDDEGINSNKTSVESLREANDNNSNNGGPRWQRDLLWDVPLGVSV